MRKPQPLPLNLTASELVDRIAARHRDDPAFELFPARTDLHGVIRYALDHHRRLPAIERGAEIADVLVLSRLADAERDRLVLRALRTGRQDGLKPRHLGPPLGIRTRQGLEDRQRTLARKVAETRYGGKVEPPAAAPVDGRELHAIAGELIAHWGDLTTDPDIDVWEEGIELILRDDRPTASGEASIAAQLKAAVQEIDELAAGRGAPAARTAAAAAALAAVRALR